MTTRAANALCAAACLAIFGVGSVHAAMVGNPCWRTGYVDPNANIGKGGGKGKGGGGDGYTDKGGKTPTSSDSDGGAAKRKPRTDSGGGVVTVRRNKRDGGSNGGGGDSETDTAYEERAPLPAAAGIKELDTSRFDKIKAELKLTSEQEKRIAALIDGLRVQARGMVKAHEDARTRYQQAAAGAEADAWAQEVNAIAQAIRNYDPSVRFNQALASILSMSQNEQYRASLQPKTAAKK